VPADTLGYPEQSWRFGDGLYLTVIMPDGGDASASHISVGFSHVGDRLEGVVVNRSSGAHENGAPLARAAGGRSPPLPRAQPAPEGDRVSR
jgi:hypothetical protein